MQGMTLESTTDALSTTISKFSSEDSFSIIAFNDKMSIFSSSLKIATTKTIKDATQWLNQNLVAGGGTNIMQPLNKVCNLVTIFICSVLFIIISYDIFWMQSSFSL